MQETVLTRIIDDKKDWLAQRMEQQPLSQFMADVTTSQRDFYQALTSQNTVFILECKKASPSKGLIRIDFSPEMIADTYAPYASAISVLTDEKYFQGNFEYVRQISQRVKQPVLCKDFFIDPYQVYLARYYQADAILLMLSVLDDQQYQQLSILAHSLGMGVLTEVSNEQELVRAIQLKAKVVGINNRNLRDLSVDLNRVKQLAPQLPADTIVISESGIYTHQQIRALRPYAHGFLIGSALMAEDNLDAAVRRIMFGEHKVCGLTRIEDANAAYQAGALYGGLIFAPQSPRYITPQHAQQLITAQPALLWIGVFVNESPEIIANLAHQLALYAVQLHGNESDDYIRALRPLLPKNCHIWRALSINDHIPLMTLEDVDRYLFDSGKGGSGKSFNWTLLNGHALDNVFLAGGLNCENVEQALSFRTAGLDFNSGVELSAGIKSCHKINTIFQMIRNF